MDSNHRYGLLRYARKGGENLPFFEAKRHGGELHSAPAVEVKSDLGAILSTVRGGLLQLRGLVARARGISAKHLLVAAFTKPDTAPPGLSQPTLLEVDESVSAEVLK